MRYKWEVINKYDNEPFGVENWLKTYLHEKTVVDFVVIEKSKNYISVALKIRID